MSTPWESPIIKINGYLNTVNETIIGGSASIGSRSRYAGQLGKQVFFDGSQIPAMFSSTVGTLYGGRYRYVKRRTLDDSSPAMTPGRIAFWNTTATNWQNAYEVTSDENLSSVDNAVAIAGIFISALTPGRYGFIFTGLGMTPTRFRTVLTAAAAIGNRVYAAGAGDTGFDQGTADTLTTDSTSLANQRHLGWAVTLPVAAGLANVLYGPLGNLT